MLRTIEARVARIARTQYGIVTRTQLLAAGLGNSDITWRLKAARLHRVHRGVYSVGHGWLSAESRYIAAVLAAGPIAAVSHRTAAATWGMWRGPLPRTIELVAVRRRRLELGQVRMQLTTDLPSCDVVSRGRIPYTSPARTVVDLGERIDAHRLANVIHEARYRDLFEIAEVERILDRTRTRPSAGHAVVRRALEMYTSGSAGTRSSLERQVLRALTRAGIPQPDVNTRVAVRDGSIEVDLCWPVARLCVEVDGPGHHRPRSRREDARREMRLRAAGYRVVRIPGAMVEGPERMIADKVGRALADGSGPV